MAVTKITYASTAALTFGPGTLADDAAWQSAAVDNTSNLYVDALVEVIIKAGSTTPAGDKLVDVWLYVAESGTVYTDNASGSDASYTMTDPNNLFGPVPIGIHTASVDVQMQFGLLQVLGFMPSKWGIVINNKSGSALATGSTANYTGITYTTT